MKKPAKIDDPAGKPLNTDALDAAMAAIAGRDGVAKNMSKDTLALAIATYLNALRAQRQAKPLRVEQPARQPKTIMRRPPRLRE